MPAFIRPALLAGIVIATATGVVACGGGSGSSSSAKSSAATSAAVSSSADATAAANRVDPFADPTVQACLKAAGVAVPTFTRPSGTFSRPSGSFTRPSGTFSRPSGSFTRPSGAGGGFGGLGTDSAQLQAVQQALKACGITLPTGGRRGADSGQPSATASS